MRLEGCEQLFTQDRNITSDIIAIRFAIMAIMQFYEHIGITGAVICIRSCWRYCASAYIMRLNNGPKSIIKTCVVPSNAHVIFVKKGYLYGVYIF